MQHLAGQVGRLSRQQEGDHLGDLTRLIRGGRSGYAELVAVRLLSGTVAAVMSVSMNPGDTALQRMPNRAASSARLRVMLTSPAFAAA